MADSMEAGGMPTTPKPAQVSEEDLTAYRRQRAVMEGAGQLVGGVMTPKAPEYFQSVLKKIVAENASYDAESLVRQTLIAAKKWGHKLEQFKQFVPESLWPKNL